MRTTNSDARSGKEGEECNEGNGHEYCDVLLPDAVLPAWCRRAGAFVCLVLRRCIVLRRKGGV